MIRKYEFTGREKDGLKQIRRISDLCVGGWIESEDNLSHLGRCWVGDDALVSGNARVYEHALIYENAQVHGNSIVHGYTKVRGDAQIYGYARVHDSATIMGNAQVRGDSIVRFSAMVYGHAQIDDRAIVGGIMTDNTIVAGVEVLPRGITISGDANVQHPGDLWTHVSRAFKMVWTKSNNMLSIGCKKHSVLEWWQLTLGPLAEEHLGITKIFRERFLDQCPPDVLKQIACDV